MTRPSEILELIERSSLGTKGAKELRDRVPRESVAEILRAADELAQRSVEQDAAARRVRSEAAAALRGQLGQFGTRRGRKRFSDSNSSLGLEGGNLAVRLGALVTASGLAPHPREEVFTVLVVDDHALLREAVVSRLVTMGAGTVHEAASVAEARARALICGPCDLAILDLTLPDGSGLDLVGELRAQGWPRIVVLASSDDPNSVRAAFQTGAQAYLLKSASPAVVTDGVRRVLDGGVYADPKLASGTRVAETDNNPRDLSAREVEVLQLVADGQSNEEIGKALCLSALTVKSHLSRIGRKLGTGDRALMVALAMRAGVIR